MSGCCSKAFIKRSRSDFSSAICALDCAMPAGVKAASAALAEVDGMAYGVIMAAQILIIRGSAIIDPIRAPAMPKALDMVRMTTTLGNSAKLSTIDG